MGAIAVLVRGMGTIAARSPSPRTRMAPRRPTPPRTPCPEPIWTDWPRALSRTSTVPSRTPTSVLRPSTTVSNVVPLTTAARNGVCTVTCGSSRLGASMVVDPKRCATTVMSSSPLSEATATWVRGHSDTNVPSRSSVTWLRVPVLSQAPCLTVSPRRSSRHNPSRDTFTSPDCETTCQSDATAGAVVIAMPAARAARSHCLDIFIFPIPVLSRR